MKPMILPNSVGPTIVSNGMNHQFSTSTNTATGASINSHNQVPSHHHNSLLNTSSQFHHLNNNSNSTTNLNHLKNHHQQQHSTHHQSAQQQHRINGGNSVSGGGSTFNNSSPGTTGHYLHHTNSGQLNIASVKVEPRLPRLPSPCLSSPGTTNGSSSLGHSGQLNIAGVKEEPRLPRLPSPCLSSPGTTNGSSSFEGHSSINSSTNSGGYSNGMTTNTATNNNNNNNNNQRKRRCDVLDSGTNSWGLPNSPGQLSISSLSPPPLMNGHSLGHNGLSPSSSYDSFSPRGKEDMSPPNSVNGFTGVDSCNDPKKKKGPAPRQQEELCLVCGDRASGYHYNALTCEGCKGFFRRSITKNAVYQCKYGNNCEIDMYMRRKCQECRLKKCLSVGMRPECVVPEYQCAIKRESKRAQKEKDKPNSTTKDTHSPIDIKEEKPCVGSLNLSMINGTTGKSSSNNNNNNNNTNNNNHTNTPNNALTPARLNGTNNNVLTPSGNIMNRGIAPLTPEQETIIQQLVYIQEEFEEPSQEDVQKITPFTLGNTEEDALNRYKHVTEMTILTIQLIVEFSKRVAGFDALLREDQITLLKAASSELMMLRSSRKYDLKSDSILYANGQPYTRENYRAASIGDAAHGLFNFCRSMVIHKVDNAEYALLTAINIFSDRPNLIQPRKVEEIQEFYVNTLKAYVQNHRSQDKCYFAKILSILTELRSLAHMNSTVCHDLHEKNKPLPPFLAEIWDIHRES